MQDPAGGAHDTTLGFSYNPANQATARTRTNGVYDYVLPGTFTESYTADGLNRYTSALGVAPSYDARGNLTNDGTRSYGYDYDSRLVTVSGGVGLNYDPAGRLHEVSAGGAATRFLYDGDNLIAEYNAAGTLLRRYVHGPGSDEPLVWYEGAGTGDRRYLLGDERGSIIGVTDGSGAVTQVNTYDAYGVPSPANQGRFQYTGQLWLPEVGLYHYKARIYHPRLGRFLQTDPIGTAGGMNLYGYTGNDPVNFADPTGLVSNTCWYGVPATSSGGCPPMAGGPNEVEKVEEIEVTGYGCDWLCRIRHFYYETAVQRFFGDMTNAALIAAAATGPVTHGQGPGGGVPQTQEQELKHVGMCFLKGAAVGAVAAVGVGALAVGAVVLGAPVAVVTGVLGVVGGVAGGITVAVTGQQIADGNYGGAAFNIGAIAGGAVIGAGGGGRALAQGVNGVRSPPWSIQSDLAQHYNPSLGPIGGWIATGTNPGSATATATGIGAAISNFMSGCD